MLVIAIMAALVIISIVATWKIFNKAGEAGWKCLIPFYSQYTQYKIAWKGGVYFVSLIASLIYAFCYGYGDVIANNTAVGLRFVALAFAIVMFVINLIFCHKLSKSFGHGFGFTLGLIFLPFIFICILAFGKSQYIGPEGKQSAAVEVKA